MSLLNLWVLALLPAVAVPALIYWFVNRRRVVIRFAAFEWMLQALNRRKKISRVNELLKLIAKTLLVLALLIFIARPVFHGFSASHILLILDNSLSMGAVEEGTARFDTAKSLAANLAAEFPRATISCHTWNTQFEAVAHAVDGGKLAGSLAQISVSGRGNGSAADFFRGLRALDEFKECDTVCFVSDFQSAQYRNPEELADEVAALRKRLIFLPVRPLDRRTANLSVASFGPAQEGFYPGRANRMTAVVRNHSDAPVNNVPVILLANGEKRDMATVSIPADGTAEAHLTVNIPTGSESLLEIRMPPDALAADNTLMLNARPRHDINILGIVPQGAADADYPPDAFVKAVISAISDNSDVLHYTAVSPAQALNAILENYDLILTFGIPFETESSLARDLNDYRKHGKSVISFAAAESAKPWKALGFNGELVTVPGETCPDRAKLAGTYLEFMTDPAFDPDLFTFRAAYGIRTAGNDGAKTWPRLHLGNSALPAILKTADGTSALILCAFPPDLSAGTFVHNPNFVQFAMRMLADALPDDAFPGASAGDETARIRIPDDIEVKDGELLTAVPFAVAENAPMPPKLDGLARATAGAAYLDFTDIPAQSAAYDVMRDRDALFRIALNPADDDSDLAPAPQEAFAAAAEHGLQVRSFSGPAENGAVLREHFTLGLILLGLALAFDFYAHFLRRR